MTSKQSRPVAFSVRLPTEQVSRLDSLVRDRDRKGNKTSRNAIVREAVGFYFHHQTDLVGSRKAIAKDLEGKIDALDAKIEDLRAQFAAFVESVTRRRTGG
jgi:predicted DNA-binding protein